MVTSTWRRSIPPNTYNTQQLNSTKIHYKHKLYHKLSPTPQSHITKKKKKKKKKNVLLMTIFWNIQNEFVIIS